MNTETDPHGLDPHTDGSKLDFGKAPIWRGLIDYFPNACEMVAQVSVFGAKKYTWKGWQAVPDGVNRYTDAMGRHLVAEARGEFITPDSGLPHAAHVAWNALARLELLHAEEQSKLLNCLDDSQFSQVPSTQGSSGRCMRATKGG